MRAHVLNSLNKFGKRDKMLGLPSILSFFHKELNKFNNTGARTLYSIYHMALKLIKITFLLENIIILPSLTQRYNRRHYVTF